MTIKKTYPIRTERNRPEDYLLHLVEAAYTDYQYSKEVR
jgi:hypothetical protein